MIKVMWFVKRADHLTLEEFERWWTETHAPDIVDEVADRDVRARPFGDLHFLPATHHRHHLVQLVFGVSLGHAHA